MRLNHLDWQEGVEARRRYVTPILMGLDPVTHTAEVVNCGQNPGFAVSGGERVRICASGPPLGLLPDQNYEIERVAMQDGSQVLL